MPYLNGFQANTGSFVPTTNVWDVSEIQEVDVTSQEFKELLIRLYQNLNNICLVLNSKDSAFYIQQEFNTGALFFNPGVVPQNILTYRPGFRIVVPCGALGAGLKTVPHGLAVTATWHWVYIGGAATDTVNRLGYPITYGGATGNNISVNVDATNIYINNQSGITTFTDSMIVLEYLKS